MTTTAERSALLSRDQRFFDALVANDLAGLSGVLAPGFLLVGIADGAIVTRAQLLDAIGSGSVSFPAVEAFPEEAVVRRVGSVGIVVGRTTMTFGGPGGDTSSTGSRYTHVFEKAGDDWLLLSAQGTEIKTMG